MSRSLNWKLISVEELAKLISDGVSNNTLKQQLHYYKLQSNAEMIDKIRLAKLLASVHRKRSEIADSALELKIAGVVA